VIAGNTAAVERAMELLKARGAKRAIKLPVSAPFHCALMQPAQDRLAADLEKIEFADLSVPLVANVSAVEFDKGADARRNLVRQVTAPVQWRLCANYIESEGVTTFIEVGPGKVLSGLVKQIVPDARCLNVADPASLEATRATLLDTQAASGGN
jgi:[acyl-carrier-protein] S-malonyltransferase